MNFFSEFASRILLMVFERPLSLKQRPSRHMRQIYYGTLIVWGCPGQHFKTQAPFDGMMQEYANFEKKYSRTGPND